MLCICDASAGSEYSALSGFNVEDFVELPSQLLENGPLDPESLALLSKHYQTGKPLPHKLIHTLHDLKTFMMGNWVIRQNELALVDQYLYTSELPNSVEELSADSWEGKSVFNFSKRGKSIRCIVLLHIFWGGYESKYYSHMRAELLEADVFQNKENGIFSPAVGTAYKEKFWSLELKPASELFFDFMGRDPFLDALMKNKGLV